MAHREDSGLLHEAVVWAYILFHEWDDFQAKCLHWPMMRTHCPCRPALVGPQQPESNHAQAFTRTVLTHTNTPTIRSNWPISKILGCGKRLLYGPTYFSRSEETGVG